MVVGPRPRVLHVRSSSALLGAEQVVLELLKNSPEFGVEASLLVLRDPNDAQTELYRAAKSLGVPVSELECGATPSRSVLKELRKACVSNSIDVIHCHGYKEDILVWLAGLKLPKVATNHLWKRTNLKLWIYSLLDALSLRNFQHVIAVSRQIQSDMSKLGIPSSRMSMILNGIDVDAFSATEPDRKLLFPGAEIEKGTRLIASLSSLTPEKGIDVLINAIGIIREMPEIGEFAFKVLVIGEGPERQRLEALIQDLDLQETVLMLGHRSDARDLLKMVDIFVLPSRNEGLPISLLEAMASNCGVIATDVGEIKSVITGPELGEVVPADNAEMVARAVAGFLVNSERLKSCQERGLERVKNKFSAREMARQYCEIYKEVLGHGKTVESQQSTV